MRVPRRAIPREPAARPWRCLVLARGCRNSRRANYLDCFSRSLPLRFRKNLRLQENTIRLDYEVTNLSQSRVKFLWSAHPLLRVEPGAEIILPQEVKEVEVSWSRDERLGKSGDRCTWPSAAECAG